MNVILMNFYEIVFMQILTRVRMTRCVTPSTNKRNLIKDAI